MLVAHDDGRLSSVADAAALLQPAVSIACLHIVGGGADKGDVLLAAEIVVDVGIAAVELVGESFQHLADKGACLVLGIVDIIVVEIPVEVCLALLLQTAEELLLHLLEQVEAHEDVVVGLPRDIGVLRYLTEEHSLVCNLLAGKPLAIVVIDVIEVAPQLQEALFELAVVFGTEVLEEGSEYPYLLF